MCTSVSPELSEAGGRGGGGNAFPSQILTDQLTLFFPGGGVDYAHSSTLVPLGFPDLLTALLGHTILEKWPNPNTR